MDSLLVSGATLVGLAVGGLLDPVGQCMADRSRAEDEARKAAGQPEPTVPLEAQRVPELAEPDPVQPLSVHPESPGHVVPSGPCWPRTVLAAIVTGALFGGAALHFGRDVIAAPFCVFFALLVVVSITDLSHRLVPRRLLYGGLALIVPLSVVTSAVDHRWHSLGGAAIAGTVAFALFFAVWWFVPQGMGFGDVRLAGTIGLTAGYLSLLHAYVAFLAGFLIGLCFGLVLMAVAGSGRRTRIPFAPSLALGAVIAVLWGGQLAHSLFHAGT